jgi:hypothetical protein
MAGTANRSAAPAATPPAIAAVICPPEGGGGVGEVEVGGGSGRSVKLLFAKLQITSKQLVIHSDNSNQE